MLALVHVLGFVFALALGYFALTLLVVLGGVVIVRVCARLESKDAAQEQAFAQVRGGWLRRGVGLLIETWSAAFDFVLRFLFLLRLLRVPPRKASGTPVVLLPGYVENGGALWWFARKLERDGFRPVIIDFPSTFSAIEDNVVFLKQQLRELREATGSAQVAIVAHSMGGVVARALLLMDPDHGVSTLIALASPFRGTHMARLGAFFKLGRSVRDMCPGSPFYVRFHPELRANVPIHCVIGSQETIVSPEWSCVLPGSDVHVLRWPVGHDGPLYLDESYQRVRAWLMQDGVELARTP